MHLSDFGSQPVDGHGHVLVWTVTADKAWSDWPSDPTYVLAMREAAKALVHDDSREHVLVAGDNFGCGSSREHAPWALTQFGFRAVLSTSFADIFRQNSLKNSLLPIVVPADVHAALFAAVSADPNATVKIDLVKQTLTTPDGRVVEFPVDGFSKHCLVEGVDELGYILHQAPAIAAYEAQHPALPRG